MKFKAILFDQDGTVADTLPLLAHSVINAIKILSNKKMTLKEVVSYFGPSEDGVMRSFFPEQPENAFKVYLEQYEKLHDEICPAPFPMIKDLLEALSSNGIFVGMVTGKCRQATEISLRKFGLLSYFKVIETGSPDGSDKINGFKRILKQLGMDKSDCLYVGDEPSDIEICRKAGMQIASAAWASTALPKVLEDMNPGMVFYTIEDFKNWILD